MKIIVLEDDNFLEQLSRLKSKDIKYKIDKQINQLSLNNLGDRLYKNLFEKKIEGFRLFHMTYKIKDKCFIFIFLIMITSKKYQQENIDAIKNNYDEIISTHKKIIDEKVNLKF